MIAFGCFLMYGNIYCRKYIRTLHFVGIFKILKLYVVFSYIKYTVPVKSMDSLFFVF